MLRNKGICCVIHPHVLVAPNGHPSLLKRARAVPSPSSISYPFSTFSDAMASFLPKVSLHEPGRGRNIASFHATHSVLISDSSIDGCYNRRCMYMQGTWTEWFRRGSAPRTQTSGETTPCNVQALVWCHQIDPQLN